MRVFSGIQPTAGRPHLGNYFGAIRKWIELSVVESAATETVVSSESAARKRDTRGSSSRGDRLFCIVDLHALTSRPQQLHQATRDMAVSLLACGLDPQKCTLFVQSKVPEHTQLAWILSCWTPFGQLQRMTQWKDKVKNKDHQENLGLFSYPVLQASDILLYQATHVPVGADQKQHLELTRDLVLHINKKIHANLLTLPEPVFTQAPRIMSLRNPEKKMSKSDPDPNSRINLDDSPDLVRKKIRKAVTDSTLGITFDPEARPGLANLVSIFAEVQGRAVEQVCQEYALASMSEFKTALTDAVVEHLKPIQEQMRHLGQDSQHVDAILEEGTERARELARANFQEIWNHFVHKQEAPSRQTPPQQQQQQ